MQPHCLLAAFLCFFGLIISSSASISPAVVSIVNAECQKCDAQFTASIAEYQQNYGQWKLSLDAAKYFCGKFDLVKQCYVDCVGGRAITYLSIKKRQFDVFYAESCDPVCYSTVMPWCYFKHVGQYRLDQSCDRNTNTLKANLGRCLVEELFYKQSCNGTCTPGQRRANFVFMQLQSSCLVPLNNQDDCFNWVQYCVGNYYGASGDYFALQTEDELRENNSLSCDFYRNKFVGCMQRSVNSRVTLGEEPSLTAYDKPCNNYQDQIDYLEDLTRERLTKAVCQNPGFSLSDICDASGSAVEPTTRSPTAFWTSASSIVVSTTNQPQPTSVATASTTQASGGDSAMVSDQLKTMQSPASRPAADSVPSSASPSTAAHASQSASEVGPSDASPSTAALSSRPASDAGLANASSTAADGGGATRVDSQPPSASLAPSPSGASTSVPTSGTTVRASSPAPATTRRNMVLGFFDLPPTTPPPTTTRRPRATLGGAGGVGGGNLLFGGPATTPGEPQSTTGGDDDYQDSTDDLLDDGGGQASVTGGRVTRPHRLLSIYEDSSATLSATPLSLLAALLLQVLLWQRLAAAPL